MFCVVVGLGVFLSVRFWQPWASGLPAGDPSVTPRNTHDFIKLA